MSPPRRAVALQELLEHFLLQFGPGFFQRLELQRLPHLDEVAQVLGVELAARASRTAARAPISPWPASRLRIGRSTVRPMP